MTLFAFYYTEQSLNVNAIILIIEINGQKSGQPKQNHSFPQSQTNAAPRHESPLLEPDITSNRDQARLCNNDPQIFHSFTSPCTPYAQLP